MQQFDAKPIDANNETGITRVLVVDDNTGVLDLFKKILLCTSDTLPGAVALSDMEATLFGSDSGALVQSKPQQMQFDVSCLQDGELASKEVQRALSEGNPYAVAFVDMRMPGGWDGLETIENLWKIDPDLQVVICTAFSDHSWEEIINRLGLTDRLLILRKPFEHIEVMQLASALSRKWWLHRQQQMNIDALEQRVHQRTVDLSSALTERQEIASRLHHQATHDVLTGLPNRELLNDRLGNAIAYAARYSHPIWVVFIDLDHFKSINDMLGHKAGDAFLIAIAKRLQEAVRETDTVARLGGDEFVVVLPGPIDDALSTNALQRIMGIVAEPVQVQEREFSLNCSVGVAIYPEDGQTPEQLIEHADIAMYRAKETGRNKYQFFTKAINDSVVERLQLEEDMKAAIKREEFVLHYQPKVDLHTGEVIGVEALVRWQHPTKGLIAPGHFIALAEETGLIIPLGAWVLRKACAQNKAWQDAGLKPVRMAVNLAASQLAQPDLVPLVTSVLRDTGLDPGYLELEITESSVMANVEHTIGILQNLKALGVQLSVDDFGTGYSSLSYLKKFPIDTLKIDQSFVRDMTEDLDDAAIVRSIISLAHSLRLNVVAEGVESLRQQVYLQDERCDQMQGFGFSKPIPAAECEALLRENRRLPKLDA